MRDLLVWMLIMASSLFVLDLTGSLWHVAFDREAGDSVSGASSRGDEPAISWVVVTVAGPVPDQRGHVFQLVAKAA
jgi:hypothetical protein